jgi:hypothetical protein
VSLRERSRRVADELCFLFFFVFVGAGASHCGRLSTRPSAPPPCSTLGCVRAEARDRVARPLTMVEGGVGDERVVLFDN